MPKLKADLRVLCELHGLATGGTIAELIAIAMMILLLRDGGDEDASVTVTHE